jgi:hypothetical protein
MQKLRQCKRWRENLYLREKRFAAKTTSFLCPKKFPIFLTVTIYEDGTTSGNYHTAGSLQEEQARI